MSTITPNHKAVSYAHKAKLKTILKVHEDDAVRSCKIQQAKPNTHLAILAYKMHKKPAFNFMQDYYKSTFKVAYFWRTGQIPFLIPLTIDICLSLCVNQ